MLKLLLIVIISLYVLSKLGRLLFSIGTSSNQSRQSYRHPDGNVNVNPASDKKKSSIKGGEYIDFEEVK